MGSGPVPWLARMVIDRVVSEYQFAEVATGLLRSRRRTSKGFASVLASLSTISAGPSCRDGLCRGPGPPKLDPTQIRPLDLLMAGVQFQKAADAMADNPLQADFTGAADRLLETGLQRLGSASEAPETAR